MHDSVRVWLAEVLRREDVEGRHVMEVGSYDVNGSVRPGVEALVPLSYVGIDMRSGPGVDMVADAADLPSLFPAGPDVVIAASTLEHAPDWKAALSGIVTVLAPGGVLLVTVPSPGYPYHGYPGDYWRFSPETMREITEAAGLVVEDLRPDPAIQGAFVKARKPAGWVPPGNLAAAWDAVGDVGLWYHDYLHRLGKWSDIQGHMPFLYETVRGCTKPVVIELGVREGNSTSALLAAVTSAHGELWSVDAAPPAVPGEWREDPRWHFLQADDMSPQAAAWLPARCDVLFIDTSHTYGHTLAELRAYVPRVRAGGTVLLHDTCTVEDGEPDSEVAKALDVFCGETGLEWSSRPGSYGLGVIRVA